jgi:hypothetical protein
MKLNAEHRRALALLAGTPRGCTESLMMAHGFKVEILAALVRDGFAVAEPELMTAGGRKIAVTRIMITEAGRRALGSRKG